jgi:glycine cleavage system aminomethyltransferase T
MGPDYTPLEAGLDMFVKLDKDFIGRDALVRQKDAGLTCSLTCMTVECGDAIPLGNESVRAGEEVVGYVSSAEHGHTVGEVIALAYLPVGLTAPGTELTIDILGEDLAATVVRAPLFDPGNERVGS